ncbi:replication factor A2 [Pancytospora philotis]|nr:replication factor A2 [Pancytospora philotis]
MNFGGGGFQESASFVEYTGVKTLRALTAKQLNALDSSEATSIHVVDGAEISNISVAGFVQSARPNSAGMVFNITDATGSIECVLWTKGAYDELVTERVRENNLLHVTGSVKVFNGKKTVNASTISIVDANYLLYHLVSALYQSLFYQHKLDTSSQSALVSLDSSINGDILQTYRNNQDENGLELDLVISMLQSKYKPSQIKDAVNYLLENCDLYSVDGTHYKTTL